MPLIIIVIIIFKLLGMHSHTRLMALCPGLPVWAGARKVKLIWILLKQETVRDSGISCISLLTDNHASTPPLSFLQAGCLSCRRTNSVSALKAKLLSTLYNKLHSTSLCSYRVRGVDGSCTKHLTIESCTVFMLFIFILIIYLLLFYY